MATSPSGTFTFLFTDIQGSTMLWQDQPAAMQHALARHDALLHQAIDAYGGHVFKTVGDAFYAAFTNAEDALGAALAAQRALAAEPWSEACAIRVRMALHTGAAEERDSDYFGTALNRVARLLSAGHGGQALLSEVTYGLVRDNLPADVPLRDLGEHRLKDLTRPEHIYQVAASDLPAAFPPLKTLDMHHHNLPVQLTPFIGREQAMAALRARLLDPQTHLLTLTGPGGTGKTRLALQIAAEVLEAFPDGVYFVNMAPIGDADLVLPTIAQTLGAMEQAGESLIETLQRRLRGTRTLLVLDNFEQVVEAAPHISILLGANAGLTALVTSRVVLHVQGEREYAVPPLALPDLHQLPSLEVLSQYEAVRLFIAHAQYVKPDFAVTNETAPAVAEICVRLDGLPLAIQLAAARIRLLPPQALLTRLGHRLTLLTGGARDLPARQRTLRATIDWSYSLLSTEEQTLFAQLAVFAGGCTIEAIDAICNPAGDLDVLEAVESLIEKSLLRQDEALGGEPRLVMLETIHEYARERLDASREAAELRRRYAAFFLALAETGEQALKGREQVAWLRGLEEEHANMRAVLGWALENQEHEIGLRLAGALWPFWQRHSHLSEGRRWLEEFLVAAGPSVVPLKVRATALTGAAWLAHDQDDFARADALFSDGLAFYRTLGLTDHVAAVLVHRGVMARGQGQYAQAQALIEEGLALQRVGENQPGIAYALFRLGLITRERGAYSRATAVYEECQAAYQALGDHTGVAFALLGLGDVARDQGDVTRVRAYSTQSLSICRTLGHQWGIGFSLNNLALAAAMQDDLTQAQALADEVLALFRAHGIRGGVVELLISCGQIACAQGAYERARAALVEGVALGWPAGPHWLVATGLEELARVAAAREEAATAARLYAATTAWRATMGAPLQPYRRTAHEATLAMVRRALGDDAFAAAWASGATLRPEQAVAAVLAAEPSVVRASIGP